MCKYHTKNDNLRDLFRWAKSIFTSRSFTSAVLSGYFKRHPDMKVAAELREYQILLPLVDMANHKPAGKTTWHAGQKVIALSSRDAHGPGEEVCTNYGPRNNTQCKFQQICIYNLHPIYQFDCMEGKKLI